ncbi:MAG: hypothetical protein U1F52_05765 [Burkholderiales bacterium]
MTVVDHRHFRQRARAGATALAAAVILAACKHQIAPVEMEVPPVEEPKAQAAVKPPTCEPRRIEVRTDVDNLMSLYATLRSMTANAQKQEFETAKREFNTYGSEVSRLTLAMLYLLPSAPFRNEAQAAQLLEPYQREKGETRGKSELRGFGQLLASQIDAWRRSEAVVAAQNVKLKDEQRRTEELQRKLDALKDVERAMIQKDQGAKPK